LTFTQNGCFSNPFWELAGEAVWLGLNWNFWQKCFPDKSTWPQWERVATAHGCSKLASYPPGFSHSYHS